MCDWRIWPSGLFDGNPAFWSPRRRQCISELRTSKPFPWERQIISICRTHKSTTTNNTVAGKPSHRPPCVGKLFLPIIPLYSKSSPAPASLVCGVERNVRKERGRKGGIKQVEGKSDLLHDKCAGTHTHMHGHTLYQQVKHFIISCISFYIQRSQIHKSPWNHRQGPNLLSAKLKHVATATGQPVRDPARFLCLAFSPQIPNAVSSWLQP